MSRAFLINSMRRTVAMADTLYRSRIEAGADPSDEENKFDNAAIARIEYLIDLIDGLNTKPVQPVATASSRPRRPVKIELSDEEWTAEVGITPVELSHHAENIAFLCPKCRDTGYVFRANRNGQLRKSNMVCDDCLVPEPEIPEPELSVRMRRWDAPPCNFDENGNGRISSPLIFERAQCRIGFPLSRHAYDCYDRIRRGVSSGVRSSDRRLVLDLLAGHDALNLTAAEQDCVDDQFEVISQLGRERIRGRIGRRIEVEDDEDDTARLLTNAAAFAAMEEPDTPTIDDHFNPRPRPPSVILSWPTGGDGIFAGDPLDRGMRQLLISEVGKRRTDRRVQACTIDVVPIGNATSPDIMTVLAYDPNHSVSVNGVAYKLGDFIPEEHVQRMLAIIRRFDRLRNMTHNERVMRFIYEAFLSRAANRPAGPAARPRQFDPRRTDEAVGRDYIKIGTTSCPTRIEVIRPGDILNRRQYARITRYRDGIINRPSPAARQRANTCNRILENEAPS